MNDNQEEPQVNPKLSAGCWETFQCTAFGANIVWTWTQRQSWRETSRAPGQNFLLICLLTKVPLVRLILIYVVCKLSLLPYYTSQYSLPNSIYSCHFQGNTNLWHRGFSEGCLEDLDTGFVIWQRDVDELIQTTWSQNGWVNNIRSAEEKKFHVFNATNIVYCIQHRFKRRMWIVHSFCKVFFTAYSKMEVEEIKLRPKVTTDLHKCLGVKLLSNQLGQSSSRAHWSWAKCVSFYYRYLCQRNLLTSKRYYLLCAENFNKKRRLIKIKYRTVS